MKYTGFTIVELLIVIVVIGILAALVLNSFAGAQAKANNAKKISAAEQLVKLVKGYYITYGAYPSTIYFQCATVDNQCTNDSGTPTTVDNTALIAELQKMGPVPDSMQPPTGGRYGVQYIYESSATYNGEPRPVRLEYWLQGNGVPCGVPGVSNMTTGASVTATNGYTSTDGTTTVCWVRI